MISTDFYCFTTAVLLLAASASAFHYPIWQGDGGHGLWHSDDHDYYAPAHYNFQYSVHDPHTGDSKNQQETRIGDLVKGYYSLKESDGTTRHVHYTADKHSGFNAVVTKTGHAIHPSPIHHHSYPHLY
ncbi:hypothetical protein AAG570_008674 [Ranatra chinensis]|uniref:Uncharacterized protein n=1 Tax=Ranatra chinensis TaxID=642074 RepID=A0ABD0YRN8_9HEMI